MKRSGMKGEEMKTRVKVEDKRNKKEGGRGME